MLAEHKEFQEVKTVVLQNRMALDLLLVAQGVHAKSLLPNVAPTCNHRGYRYGS